MTSTVPLLIETKINAVLPGGRIISTDVFSDKPIKLHQEISLYINNENTYIKVKVIEIIKVQTQTVN